jgi:hypothetical protein
MSANFSDFFIEQYTTNAMSWTQTIGCVLCIYGYFIYTKRILWTVLLVHGISGFLGTLLENFFVAKRLCCRNEDWSSLLGINEIFWTLHESSTVYYSLLKLEPIITNPVVRRVLRGILVLCLVGYSAFRILIGVYRIQANAIRNDLINWAHSFAFLCLGIADLILFGLLVQNTTKYLHCDSEQLHVLINKLFQSSIPRICIIILNTFLLVLYSQFGTNPSRIRFLGS